MIPFIKMHGIGNDFVVIDDRAGALDLPREEAARICDRRFGVGADQILWLKPPRSPGAECFMEVLNPDGGVGGMCGNGIRAVGLFLQTEGRPQPYRVDTRSGLKVVEMRDGARAIRVDMGEPRLVAGFDPGADHPGETLRVPARGASPEREFRFWEIDVGNPHAVIFVPSVAEAPVEEYGSRLEHHPRFPERANIGFVEVTGPSSLRVRVWERGAGLTLACGTGATAAATAAIATGRVKSPVRVALPGGELTIAWAGTGEPASMEGPAAEVFRGVWPR